RAASRCVPADHATDTRQGLRATPARAWQRCGVTTASSQKMISYSTRESSGSRAGLRCVGFRTVEQTGDSGQGEPERGQYRTDPVGCDQAEPTVDNHSAEVGTDG